MKFIRLRNGYLNIARYQKANTKYPFKLPLGNLIAVLAEDLDNGDSSLLECFLAKWKNQDHNPTTMALKTAQMEIKKTQLQN